MYIAGPQIELMFKMALLRAFDPEGRLNKEESVIVKRTMSEDILNLFRLVIILVENA